MFSCSAHRQADAFRCRNQHPRTVLSTAITACQTSSDIQLLLKQGDVLITDTGPFILPGNCLPEQLLHRHNNFTISNDAPALTAISSCRPDRLTHPSSNDSPGAHLSSCCTYRVMSRPATGMDFMLLPMT